MADDCPSGTVRLHNPKLDEYHELPTRMETLDEVQHEIGRLFPRVQGQSERTKQLLMNLRIIRMPMQYVGTPLSEDDVQSDESAIGLEYQSDPDFKMDTSEERTFNAMITYMDDLEFLWTQGHCGKRLIQHFRRLLEDRKDTENLTYVALYSKRLMNERFQWSMRHKVAPVALQVWTRMIPRYEQLKGEALSQILNSIFQKLRGNPEYVQFVKTDVLPLFPEERMQEFEKEGRISIDYTREFRSIFDQIMNYLQKHHPSTHQSIAEHVFRTTTEHSQRTWTAMTNSLMKFDVYIECQYMSFMCGVARSKRRLIDMVSMTLDQFYEKYEKELRHGAFLTATLGYMALCQATTFVDLYVQKRYRGSRVDLQDDFPDGLDSVDCIRDQLQWLMCDLTMTEKSALVRSLEILPDYPFASSEKTLGANKTNTE